jgi:hypothetical protein
VTDYTNKRFSILGDSVSTLDGYNPPEYLVYYEGYRKFDTDVFFKEDTWWGQVISALGGRLLVNESFSGSLLAKHRECIIPSYGCSDERTSSLGKYGQSPDVIIVYMGTNDWADGRLSTDGDPAKEQDDTIFSVAYRMMLEKLKKNYPNAEIWCCTLAVSTCKKKKNFEFSVCPGGVHIEKYCEVIRVTAEAHNCRVIDLYNHPTPYDTIDDYHPNREGMVTLAEAVISQVKR